MIEHRAQERVEIGQLALIHVDGVRGVYPCLVMDLNNQGARLRSSTFHIVAFDFDLSLDGFKTTKHCHVVWRDGNTCGVEFVDRSHANTPG
jgi:hypothetical protein